MQGENWSRGKVKSVPCCPACNAINIGSSILKRRDNDNFMPDIWKMKQCYQCQSIWLDPKPDAISLPKAYDNYYTHSSSEDNDLRNKGKGVIWTLIRGYLNKRFGIKYPNASSLGYYIFSLIAPLRLKLDYFCRHLTVKNVGKPSTLLDIGCGNGNFLSRANEMGLCTKGCEVDEKAVKACVLQGLDVIHGDAFSSLFAELSFDIITLSHVIEHVDDPKDLLKRIHALLNTRGVLWLACPNPNSFGFKIFKQYWQPLHPPFHLCIPSQFILLSWLEESGFEDIQFLRRGVHARTMWQLSQKITENNEQKKLHRFMFLLGCIAMDIMATVTPRFSEETVLIARKKSKQ